MGCLSLVKGKDENLSPEINGHHAFPADRQPGRLLADNTGQEKVMAIASLKTGIVQG